MTILEPIIKLITSTKHRLQLFNQGTHPKCPIHNNGLARDNADSKRNKDLEQNEKYQEIIKLNEELPDSTITLFVPPNYDKSLLPIKAEKSRDWWEEDTKTFNHARFCLPLTMGSGIGYYILSPATFTVTWDGDREHDAEIEILDASSHTSIDNHSSCGSFTVQAVFSARTKNPGDFLYIKGVSNQYRLPFTLLDAMIEAWWSPANFGLVALLNQAGTFTIKKGEPLGQMFVVADKQAKYELAVKDGYAPVWQEWEDKRRDPSYTGRNMDYLRGLWPNGKAVCPHFKEWPNSDLEGHGQKVQPGQQAIGASQNQVVWNDEWKAFLNEAREAMTERACPDAEKIYDAAFTKMEDWRAVNLKLAEYFHELGLSYLKVNKVTEGEPLLKKGASIREQLGATSDESAAHLYNNLGWVYRFQGAYVSSEENYRKALAIREKISPESEEVANSLFELGTLYDGWKRLADAEPLLSRSLTIRQKVLGEEHPDTLYSLNGLACLYTHMGRLAESESMFHQVIALRIKVLGEEAFEVANTYIDLAFLYKATKDFPRVEEYFKKALLLREKKYGHEHLEVADAHEHLGFLYRDLEDNPNALIHFQKVLEIKEALFGENTFESTNTLTMLGHIHKDLGEHNKADEHFSRANRLRTRHHSEKHSG